MKFPLVVSQHSKMAQEISNSELKEMLIFSQFQTVTADFKMTKIIPINLKNLKKKKS